MRVNAIALMRAAGVSCLHDDGTGAPVPARVALVTEDSVRAARALAGEDPALIATETSPQLRYGGALAYVGSGSARRLILAPGEGGAFRLRNGIRFLGPHMLDAERALSPLMTDEAAGLLSGIRSILRLVATVPDEDRFPADLIGQACRFSWRDAFGEGLLPIGVGGLVMRSRADLLRARIGTLDPASPDALGSAIPFPRLLDRAGADVRSDGVRVDGLGRLTGSDLRHLIEQGPLRGGLFARLTRTPPDRIEAIVLPAEEAHRVERSLEAFRLSGAWVEAVRMVGAQLTGSGTNGYRLDLTLYAAEGRDLLILSDTVGQETGVSLAFSWPSRDRAPTLEDATGPIYAICPEEAPAPDEVIRLERVLNDIMSQSSSAPGTRQTLDA